MIARGGFVSFGLALLALAPLPAVAQSGEAPLESEAVVDAPRALHPPASTTLRYHLVQRVGHGSGQYEGWSDVLASDGDYRTSGTNVHAHYAWAYGSSDRQDDGDVTRDVSFDEATRQYADRTDLDDYDRLAGPLTTWLWIPTGELAVGAHVRILDDDFVVVGDEETAAAGGTRSAVHLHGESQGTRDDAYGRFTTSAVDDYWFDTATGMFLSEHRVETDRGTYDGQAASFEMTLTVTVVDASYAPAIGPIPSLPQVPRATTYASSASDDGTGGLGIACFCSLAGLFGFFFVWLVVQSNRRARLSAAALAPRFFAEELSTSVRVPEGLSALSARYGVFLAHWVEVALRAGQRAWVARETNGSRLAGLAIDDADAQIVAIYASSPDCAERLRVASTRQELISENRYDGLEAVKDALASAGRAGTENTYAYNLYEAFDVLARTGPIEPMDYDARMVVRMTEAHLPEVTAIAKVVYGATCEAFLRASLAAGDVAFVARDGSDVYGFALATVVGTSARLHLLTVDPSIRSRGIAKELYRARLRALSDLCVEEVVTEVAQNNPGAIEIARQFGMKRVGSMYVQSARASRDAVPAASRVPR